MVPHDQMRVGPKGLASMFGLLRGLIGQSVTEALKPDQHHPS